MDSIMALIRPDLTKIKEKLDRCQGTPGWNEVNYLLIITRRTAYNYSKKSVVTTFGLKAKSVVTTFGIKSKSVVTTFGLNFFRLAPFRNAR